jgi:hypothetical protein
MWRYSMPSLWINVSGRWITLALQMFLFACLFLVVLFAGICLSAFALEME